MNFKPKLFKITMSIILGVIVNYILAGTARIQCLLIEGGTCRQPTWIEHASDFMPIIISLICIVITYIIWSLIEKK